MNEVSGCWVKGRPPQGNPGLMLYIMVVSVAATVDTIVARGGEIVQPIGADAPKITARFRPRRKRNRPVPTGVTWLAEAPYVLGSRAVHRLARLNISV